MRVRVRVGAARLAHVLHHEGREAPAERGLAAHQLVRVRVRVRVRVSVRVRVRLGLP